jgi:hypothetical protein
MEVHNVRDRRSGRIVSTMECERLSYESLTEDHVGRTVIFHDGIRLEAGTITSWRDGVVFARYTQGDTAAGAKAEDLLLVVSMSDQ